MGLKVTNNAFGTLNAGITSSATTIVLTAGQGARFPTLSAGDYFYATLIDTSNNLEIVKVTARSTDTMTIVRAQDNTTARAYSTNDRFELRPTAALFNEKANDADVTTSLATKVNTTGGTITGRLTVKDNVNADPSFPFAIQNGSQDQWWLRATTTTNNFAISRNGLGDVIQSTNSGLVTTPYQPSILCKVFRASSSIGYYSLEAKSARNLSVGTYGGNSAIIAPVAGVYAVSFNGITSSSTGRVDLMLYKNGGLLLSSLTQEGVSGYQYRSIVATLVLAQGDALQMYHGTAIAPYYASGSGGDLEWCNFSVTLIG
jgi:hypothetical protein